MTAVRDKSLPLQVALQINNQDMARFMTAIMVMQSDYNKKISQIVRFNTVDRFFAE